MRTLKLFIFSLALASILFSCSNPKQDTLDEIADLENVLFSEGGNLSNLENANALINKYINFADLYPEDSLAPEFLFKAADVSMNINSGELAINLYNRIIENYQGFRKAPECLFLKAYVYENNLGDLENARFYYQQFIDKYPDNDFADDAEISIQNLGKSPEELIQEFEEKLKAQEGVD